MCACVCVCVDIAFCVCTSFSLCACACVCVEEEIGKEPNLKGEKRIGERLKGGERGLGTKGEAHLFVGNVELDAGGRRSSGASGSGHNCNSHGKEGEGGHRSESEPSEEWSERRSKGKWSAVCKGQAATAAVEREKSERKEKEKEGKSGGQ